MKYLKYRQGFTLIELLVAIAIIGILSAIVLASLNDARSRSANASIMSNLSGIRAQAELFFASNGEQYSQTSINGTNNCLISANANPTHILEIENIDRAIEEARKNAGAAISGSQVRCVVDQTKWYVTVVLKKPYLNNNWFCVDYTGVAKMTVNGWGSTSLPSGSNTFCQ